ncbi:STAS domain-containing protein [Nocardioides halotolerans]|uniref:STAS domain-containing protein n=1 Tax=Nocardioides halotolerans TaxID=433660 RepID=UPI00042279C8|nr:STAS domain-containing protein [Nocardioides halotolerans]
MITPFSFDLDEDRRVLVLHGELDEVASGNLRTTISKATDELSSDLAIDLGDVTFMPSPAIGVLASSKAVARQNGATITFVAAPGSIAARLLTICSLDYVESLD